MLRPNHQNEVEQLTRNSLTVPATDKTLILYVFHELTPSVLYFTEHGVFEHANYEFLFIINSTDDAIQLPQMPANVRVLRRENIGFDFGAWSDGLFLEDNYNKYSNYIFINSTVAGPFMPKDSKKLWPELFLERLSDTVKLVGTTINACGLGTFHINETPHIQSMMFACDSSTVQFLIGRKIFVSKLDNITRDDLVRNHEIRMSRVIIESGFNIQGLMRRYTSVDFRIPYIYIPRIWIGNINTRPETIKRHLRDPFEVVFVKCRYYEPVPEQKYAGDISWIVEWAYGK